MAGTRPTATARRRHWLRRLLNVLYVRHTVNKHGQHGPGYNEFWFEGGSLAEHRRQDMLLKSRGDGPKNCVAKVEKIKRPKEWGDRPEKVSVCTPGCSACRHGYHTEEKDAPH